MNYHMGHAVLADNATQIQSNIWAKIEEIKAVKEGQTCLQHSKLRMPFQPSPPICKWSTPGQQNCPQCHVPMTLLMRHFCSPFTPESHTTLLQRPRSALILQEEVIEAETTYGTDFHVVLIENTTKLVKYISLDE